MSVKPHAEIILAITGDITKQSITALNLAGALKKAGFHPKILANGETMKSRVEVSSGGKLVSTGEFPEAPDGQGTPVTIHLSQMKKSFEGMDEQFVVFVEDMDGDIYQGVGGALNAALHAFHHQAEQVLIRPWGKHKLATGDFRKGDVVLFEHHPTCLIQLGKVVEAVAPKQRPGPDFTLEQWAIRKPSTTWSYVVEVPDQRPGREHRYYWLSTAWLKRYA